MLLGRLWRDAGKKALMRAESLGVMFLSHFFFFSPFLPASFLRFCAPATTTQAGRE